MKQSPKPPPKPWPLEGIEVFWKPEPYDDLIPGDGFLHDFILSLRGVETPTVFALWSAIGLMSMVAKRDTYLQWFPENLFPNFFLIFIAPPKFCAKSTAARFAERIVSGYEVFIEDEKKSRTKRVNLLRSRATPEAMAMLMLPQEELYTEGGVIKKIELGSQLSLVLSELSTFLGKQKYNVGLIDKLTDYYDCKEEDDDATIGRGYLKFRNVYFTLMGATTPDGLESSIPEEAFGSGFMSRIILVFQDQPTRAYPTPRFVEGGPLKSDLQRRLAWIAEYKAGEYTLSPDARLAYDTWYYAFHKKLTKEGFEKNKLLMYNRYDIHLLKLALILTMQKYQVGTVISLEEFQLAQTILDRTFSKSLSGAEKFGTNPYQKLYSKVSDYMQRKGSATRRTLLTAFSPYGCTSETLVRIMEHLAQEEKVKIYRDSQIQDKPSAYGKEFYTWDGEKQK